MEEKLALQNSKDRQSILDKVYTSQSNINEIDYFSILDEDINSLLFIKDEVNDFVGSLTKYITIVKPKLDSNGIYAFNEKIKKICQQYLNDTDWYIIRKFESNKPIPEIVSYRRNECKLMLD